MPSGGYNNGSGASGNSGNDTDWGQVIDNVGGLVDQLFDGDFWDFISGLGCMSSDYRLKFIKDRFPQAIDAMRLKSGVSSSMTVQTVNDFSKRLQHHLKEFNDNPGGGCRGTYSERYIDMLTTYINALKTLLVQSGFVQNGMGSAVNFNQQDIGGYMFEGSKSFSYPMFVYNSTADNNTGDYTTIDTGIHNLPKLNSISLMNWGVGLGLAGLGFVWLRDEGQLKDLGFKPKSKNKFNNKR